MTTTKNAHLIDLPAVFFRYYFAPGPAWYNDEGWDVSTIVRCTRWLLNPLFFQSDYVLLAFDESLGTGFRHHLDEDYKANRPFPPEDVIYQMECLKHIAECLGFQISASQVYEADDLIATACSRLDDVSIMIHSRDKDLRQLLRENVSLVDFTSGLVMNEPELQAQEGLRPDQVPLYLAIVGDASDNIAGIPGVGDKTAKALIQHYGSWEAMVSAAEMGETLPVRGSARIAEKLLAFSEYIPHNLALTLLRDDADLDVLRVTQAPDWDNLDSFSRVIGIDEHVHKWMQRVRP